ncbi:MAG: aminotransferase class V-fold PLP-dependent enzyme [Clostridia bacterium]|nr:aminotransferase class V-fold PLP-dependent enzyme [Clostridia bacterium]
MEKIYLDNAATSGIKPQAVFDGLFNLHRYVNVNSSRGGYERAVGLNCLIADIRKLISDSMGLSEGTTVFTGGCTNALNYAISGSITQDCHVISSVMEHNSVLRPLCEAEKKGTITLTLLEPEENGSINPKSVEQAILPQTTIVVLTHVSNVTGAVNDIESIGKITKEHNLRFIVDAAQSAGHLPVAMDEANVDLLAIPAHKGLMGLTGLGCLLVRKGVAVNPIIFGGTGTQSQLLTQPKELPEALESGTLNISGIVALGESLKWWLTYRKVLSQNILQIQAYLLEFINTMPDIVLKSVPMNRSGIVSISIGNLDSNVVADILDKKYDIEVRGGLHCAPLIHRHLGTAETGLVRISLSGLTPPAYVKRLTVALKQIVKKYCV